MRPEADGSAKLRPTEAGSEAGSKFPDCLRIRSAAFDYRVKAPDEHRPTRSMNHAAIKEIAMPRTLIVSIQQGERPMRKIIVGAQVSMDGVMQSPGGSTEDPTKGFTFARWALPYLRHEG